MDLETALSFVNNSVLSKTGRKLRLPELTILRGTWQGLTYDQMAESSEYSSNYLMRDIGPKFWKLLSDVLDENVGKNNLRVVLEKLHAPANSQLEKIKSNQKSSWQLELGESAHRHEANSVDWGDAPTIPSFYYGGDRTSEMLKRWIVEDNCRLIGLWGLAGVGKTSLMRKLAEQVKEKFEIVVWRSLAQAPTLKELIATLPEALMGSAQVEQGNLVSELVEKLRSHSCLILLDGVEAILQPGHRAGIYQPGYEDYEHLFQVAGETFHQSCIMITCLDHLGGIFQIQRRDSPIRSFQLPGLTLQAAQIFLTSEKLTAPEAWQSLISYYRGNPAALSIATKLIRNLFDGNVAEFLAQQSLVFGELDRLLGKSFNRLSLLEKEVLYWLASEEKPLSLNEIQSGIPLSIYSVELIEALESLSQRSLLETQNIQQKSLFTISPMIREFVTNQFIAQIGNEFAVREQRQRQLLSVEGSLKLNSSAPNITNLSQWLQNRFELGWQSVEVLFTPTTRSPSRLRSAFHLRGDEVVKRFKQVELGATDAKTVMLLMAIAQEEKTLKICVQAQPEQQQQELPNNLQLSLVDRKNITIAEVKSENQDNFIQLPYFWGEKSERFKIKLNLNSTSYEEEFII